MCAGSILANRELYLIFARLLNSFKVETYDRVDAHPVHGNADPTSLVAMPRKYRVKFVPRLEKVLATNLGISRKGDGIRLDQTKSGITEPERVVRYRV